MFYSSCVLSGCFFDVIACHHVYGISNVKPWRQCINKKSLSVTDVWGRWICFGKYHRLQVSYLWKCYVYERLNLLRFWFVNIWSDGNYLSNNISRSFFGIHLVNVRWTAHCACIRNTQCIFLLLTFVSHRGVWPEQTCALKRTISANHNLFSSFPWRHLPYRVGLTSHLSTAAKIKLSYVHKLREVFRRMEGLLLKNLTHIQTPLNSYKERSRDNFTYSS